MNTGVLIGLEVLMTKLPAWWRHSLPHLTPNPTPQALNRGSLACLRWEKCQGLKYSGQNSFRSQQACDVNPFWWDICQNILSSPLTSTYTHTEIWQIIFLPMDSIYLRVIWTILNWLTTLSQTKNWVFCQRGSLSRQLRHGFDDSIREDPHLRRILLFQKTEIAP